MQSVSQVQLNGPAVLGTHMHLNAQIHLDAWTASEHAGNENIVLRSNKLPRPPPSAASIADVNVLAPEGGPPEIEALILAQTAFIPISIVLCRDAEIAPFKLPIGCGCAFLGFFYIQDVQTRTEVGSPLVLPETRSSSRSGRHMGGGTRRTAKHSPPWS